jgi:hypothetical protein
MSGCENILRADLVKSENFTNIVLPRSGQQITNYIFYTADNRAGSCVLSLRADHFLAEKGGSSFLYIYATNFCTQMPRSEKVSAGAPGVPDATANARKRVESILKLSNEEIANTLSNLTHEQYESIAPFFRVVFCLIECWQGDKSSNPEKSKVL